MPLTAAETHEVTQLETANRKIYVLDTNVLLHDTTAVTAFAELGNHPISGTSPALINLEIDQLARYVHRQLQFITPT